MIRRMLAVGVLAGGLALIFGAKLRAQAPGRKAMTAPLEGTPEDRMGSGTSWIPDASVPRQLLLQAGPWMLMAQGDLTLYADAQGTSRGASEVGSTNWAMLMAMRQAGGGSLRLDAMASAEPWTVRGGGYPLLLQSGESYRGQPLHDRQHPHDLWMELSAAYEHSLTRGLVLSLYAAPVGEPALGPVAFMHRPSAQDDPFANIAHHWQDATHVTYGVATGGLSTRRWKLEASLFNGREPDEDRRDFDLRPLDSWSVRFLGNPAPRWSFNASYGFLASPEARHPDESLERIGVSVTYLRPVGRSGQWASSLIYGANRHHPPGGPSGALSNSVLAESDLRLDDRTALFGRVTWVQKDTAELAVGGVPGSEFGITSVSLGFSRSIGRWQAFQLEVGARGDVGFVPGGLRQAYGTATPAGLILFARFRPAIRSARAHEPMGGMDM